MLFHQMSTEEALQTLNASPQGLSTAEAKKRLAADGANSLTEEKRKGVLRVFLEQFADFMIIILIGAAILSLLTDNAESAIVILVVITLNAVLGTVQHFKAQKSLDSLQAMSSPTAKVMRDGQTQIIPAAEIVKGDIVLIEAGDIIPADGRILEAATLLVNESALTGEAIAIEKHIAAIAAASRKNGALQLGVSTRAAISLLKAAQARALLDGRDYVIPEDVQEMAEPVLAHRLVLSAEARMRNMTPQRVLQGIMSSVQVPVKVK